MPSTHLDINPKSKTLAEIGGKCILVLKSAKKIQQYYGNNEYFRNFAAKWYIKVDNMTFVSIKKLSNEELM